MVLFGVRGLIVERLEQAKEQFVGIKAQCKQDKNPNVKLRKMVSLCCQIRTIVLL